MKERTRTEQRRKFYERHLRGESYAGIAESEKVSKECVRYWCRRQRDGGSCRSRYFRVAPGYLVGFDPKVRYGILRLRLEHPGWGPNRIRMGMKKRPSLKGLRLPGESSIGRYLHQWDRFRRQPRTGASPQRVKRATRVHQRWQVDFKMGMRLKDGSLVNLCTIRDPVGAACLGAFVFSAGQQEPGQRVSFEQLRSALRLCFARWNTLPEEIQTDNEAVFVGASWDAFPSRFTLWLLGLGIAHVRIRPGCPTDNAEVERCHRTIYEYAILGNEDAHLAELQVILDEAVEELSFNLPSQASGCRGLPPIQAHPELLQPRRPFKAQHELAWFDLQAVDAGLAKLIWQRKVGKTGQITLSGAHEYYSVGRAYAHQQVLVRFDPLDRHFVFSLPEDPETEIGRRPARNLEIADFTGIAAWPIGLGVQQLFLPLPLFQGVHYR
jgi:transposase InsO family protein